MVDPVTKDPVAAKADDKAAPKAKKAKKGPTALKAKGVKRRMARIASDKSAKKQAKRKNKLAANILRQIATGKIKSPVAMAKAFAKAETKLNEQKPDAAAADDKKPAAATSPAAKA